MADDYAVALVDQANWENKIFHSESGVSSVGHCLALCRVADFSSGTYECNMLSYDATTQTCYLGNNDKNTFTHTVPSGQSQVYLDRGMNTG